MDGRIGHLRCRVLQPAGGRTSTATLERIARERVAPALAEALEPTLGGDPSVYVLRHLRAGLVLAREEGGDDAALGRRWGESLAARVTRALAARDEGATDVVRFADQAEFVARFAADLVAGSAWDAWFYGAFGALRPMGSHGALRAVLLDHRELLPAILVWLRRHEALEQVLAALDDATLRLLLHADAEEDAVRPLLSSALRLLERLGRIDAAQIDEAVLLERYLATRPSSVSWRDRRSLAEGVLEAVRFLLSQRVVAQGAVAAVGQASPPLPAGPFAELDWVDAEWLRGRVGEVLAAAPGRAAEGAGHARRELTPARRRVLAELEELLVHGRVALDLQVLDTPGNVLRLAGALASRMSPGFDDDVVHGVIAAILRAAAELRSSATGGRTTIAPATADRDAWRAAIFHSGRDPAEAAVLAELVSGAGVMAAAIRPPPAAAAAGAEAALVTPCAGAVLLTRAALDLRVPALAAACAHPARGGFARLMLALAARWGGPAAVAGGRVDPALTLLAGEPAPPAADELDAGCDPSSPAGRAFERAFLEALARHGVVDSRTLVVHRLSLHGRRVLVAGPEGETVWPLARVTSAREDDDAVLDAWSEDWAAAVGTRPRLRRAASSDALCAALAAIAPAEAGPGPEALSLDLTALALIRAWARWLRGFEAAGAPYLLDQLVRRPGRVQRSGGELTVWLQPRPLDVVLAMAGYLDELDATSALGCRIRFVIGEG